MARMLPPSPFVSDILLALLLGAVLINTPVRHVLGIAPPSGEREPDRYAAGLRFTGKWVLRAGIILMGLKVQTGFFGHVELLLIAGVAAAALPSAFFVAHSLAALLGVRRPMADLLAGGTMICGASAVNAAAPVVGARREEQGLAIGVVFLFSIAALLAFRPIAAWLGLDPAFSGLWSGLAVNDLSSAVAVGNQMGGAGGVMAAASKSARILLLAPMLVALSLVRREGKPLDLRKTATEQLPGFLLGYIALAAGRALGDRLLGGHAEWAWLLAADKFLVDLIMATVSAGIGLHLAVRALLVAGPRALAVGGGTSVWMASLTLAMVTAASRSAHALAGLIGVISLFVTYGVYRVAMNAGTQIRALRRRFDSGAPLSLAETTRLLEAAERDGELSEPLLRRILTQLHPSIGELIPVRQSPLPHGDGCRWITCWEGRQGWALVALCREPGTSTPIHAHPHRLLGKAIEGILEELRFTELSGGLIELSSRRLLGHNELVETDALDTVHVIRVAGSGAAIDLQLRGPEVGRAGRRLRTREPVDFATLATGSALAVTEEIDDRPGHGGEGASAGKLKEAG
jgi:uncharacterized integral membrane protein (TIGR00698 family)